MTESSSCRTVATRTNWSKVQMVSSYALAQKKKVRVTLELNVFQDFDAKQIDFEKLFELEPAESVQVYVEDFSENPW